MIEKLKEIKERYLEVEKLLSLPGSTSNMALYKKQSKEYKDLEKIVVEYESYLKIITGLKEAKNIYEKEKDIEFRGLAKKETEELIQKKNDI